MRSWVRILAVPFSGCLAASMLLHPALPPFLHWQRVTVVILAL